MVDEGRVARLLRGVDERVQRLEAERDGDRGRREQSLWLDGVKYLFVIAIEGSIDIAHHLAASERWGAPDTNADAFRVLQSHGVLDPGAARAMVSAAGFRNVLVHQYAIVDDERVVAMLDELEDLRRFVQQVSAWVTTRGT